MQSANSLPKFAVFAPIAVAAGFIGTTLIRFTGASFGGHYNTWHEYANDAFFVLALIGIATSVFLIQHAQAGRGRRPAIAVAIGDVLLIVGVMIGMITGEDPGWFFIIAGPALLLNLFGLIALATRSWNVGLIPNWALTIIAATIPIAVIGAEAHLSFIASIGWLGAAAGFVRWKRSSASD
jgi:hypothetical protein